MPPVCRARLRNPLAHSSPAYPPASSFDASLVVTPKSMDDTARAEKIPTIHTHTHTPLNFGLFIPNNYSLRRTSTERLNGTGRRWSGEPDAIRAPSLSLCLFLSGSVGGGTTTTTSACSREGEKKMDSAEGKATLQGCCRDVMRALRGGILVWSEQQLVEANARRSAFRCSACTNHKVARASSPARCLEDAVGVSHRRQRE